MPHITEVRTHHRPHLDEVVALWLLRQFGQEQFPGVDTASVTFDGNGGKLADGVTEAELLDQGILLLGIGRGTFDEHAASEAPEKQGHCCATLMARYLEVEKDPAVKRILDSVLKADAKGGKDVLHLATLVGDMWDDGCQFDKVWEFVCEILERKLRAQDNFQAAGQAWLARDGHVCEIDSSDGKKLRVAFTRSEQESGFARWKEGGNCDIAINRDPVTACVTIFARSNDRFPDLVAAVRACEASRAKESIPRWGELRYEELQGAAGRWFYPHSFKPAALFNGSTAHPDVTPTALTNEEILGCIKIALGSHLFKECDGTTCTKGRCPWYSFDLARCHKVRHP